MTLRPPLGLPQNIGRYQVGRVIGRGGFATVVKAFDEALKSDVAIKILDSQFSDDPDISQRFLNEGQLLRRVNHLNVVSIHDLGQLEDGRYYYVMPFANGGTLSERVPKGPALVESSDVRRVIDALVGGLSALHSARIVHRDVKPGNILIASAQSTELSGATGIRRGLVGREERLMLCDLGLAKVMDNTSIGSEPVKATVLGGSMHYQAPEQSQLGAAITEATDVYGASGVIWNLLTGAPPPVPADLEASLVGIPTEWHDFFGRGLAARPDQRFPTIEGWGRAAAVALDKASGTGFTPSISGALCPYKGLAAFQPEDAQFFFGRERLIDELTVRLQSSPTLVIGGSSGSGKSSLMRAGLLSALSKGALPGSQSWKIILFSPGRDPLNQLLRQTEDVPKPSETIGSGVLLAIDQFEEIFTGSGDPSEFITTLAQLSHDHLGRLRTVIAVRADFYGACSEHTWLAEAINRNSVLVGPLGRAELRAAVEGPARKAGLGLEEGLADRILEQAPDDAGALPLIAHALMETWLRRRNDLLTVNGLEAAGGVGGAIAQTADHTYDSLGLPEQEMMRVLFLDLVNAGAGSPDTRRRIPMEDLRQDPKMCALAERLADARLLTIDSATVELAHEALINTWPRFRGWIDQARDDLRLRERVEAATAAWTDENEDSGLLYRGTALAAAVEHQSSARFSADQQRFLSASLAAEQAEIEAENFQTQRRQRLRRLVIAGLSVITALAVAASIAAVIGLQRARENERAAEKSLLEVWAGQTNNLRSTDPLTALLVAAESVARGDGTSTGPQQAVVLSRLALAQAGLVPVGKPIEVGGGKTIALNPAGTTLAAGSRSGQLTLISLESREIIATSTAHTAGIESAAFSPDGSRLATSDAHGVIWLWDIENIAEGGLSPIGSAPIAEAGSAVWSIAYSPSGDRLAATTEDGKLWEIALEGAASPSVLFSVQADLLSVVYSPDGETIAVGSGTGAIRLIDGASGNVVFDTNSHTGDIWQLMFTPDGRRLLSVSTLTVAQDARTGEVFGTIFENSDGEWVKAIALLNDGSVVGGTNNGSLKLGQLPDLMGEFSTMSSTVLGVGHEDEVTDGELSSSADGSLVASLSGDGDVRLWSAPTDAPTQIATVEHDVFEAAQNPSGSKVALGGGSEFVTVIDLESGQQKTLGGHAGPTFGVDFLKDTLVTGDSAGTLRQWDDAGALVNSVSGHAERITGVAVNRGNEWVVSVASDGTVRFWDDQLKAAGEVEGTIANGATSVAIAPDGEFVAVTGSGGALRFWNRDGSAKGTPVTLDDNTLWDVAFSPDGKLLASASADEVVDVWRVEDLLSNSEPSPLHSLRPQSRGAVAVEFGHSSSILYTANRSGEVRLWNPGESIVDTQIGPALKILEADVWGLAPSPTTESVIAAGVGGEVFLVDLLDLGRSCELTALAADQRVLDDFLSGQPRQACNVQPGGG